MIFQSFGKAHVVLHVILNRLKVSKPFLVMILTFTSYFKHPNTRDIMQWGVEIHSLFWNRKVENNFLIINDLYLLITQIILIIIWMTTG